MSTDAVSRVVLAGGSPTWRHRAAEALSRSGFEPVGAAEIGEAVALVKTDESISAVVFAEGADKDTLLAAMTRMAVARPDLWMVVLAAEYDLAAMVKYLQLGQRG